MTQQETILEALKNQPLNRRRIGQLLDANEVQVMRLINELCVSGLIYLNSYGEYAKRPPAPNPESAA
jgi:predicted transcriptional regulator